MSSNVMRVSQSKVKAWLQCPKLYDYKYVQKLKKRVVKRPFQFGTIVHSMIEAAAADEDPFEVLDNIDLKYRKMFAKEKEMYGEIIQDIRYIMTDYFRYYGNDQLVIIRKNGKYAEHEFEIELEPGLIWTGKVDALGKKRDSKLRWVIDHKTFTRMPNEEERWRNLQGGTYVRAVQLLGWMDPDGMCWNYVNSKPPVRPRLTKSGKISKTSRIRTLPSVVIDTIKEHGLKKDDYREFLALLRRQRSSYYQRVFTPTPPGLVQQVYDDFVKSAREIAEMHGRRDQRNIGRHCGWCDYEPLCRAALRGLDYDFVKKREYTINAEEVGEVLEDDEE